MVIEGLESIARDEQLFAVFDGDRLDLRSPCLSRMREAYLLEMPLATLVEEFLLDGVDEGGKDNGQGDDLSPSPLREDEEAIGDGLFGVFAVEINDEEHVGWGEV